MTVESPFYLALAQKERGIAATVYSVCAAKEKQDSEGQGHLSLRQCVQTSLD